MAHQFWPVVFPGKPMEGTTGAKSADASEPDTTGATVVEPGSSSVRNFRPQYEKVDDEAPKVSSAPRDAEPSPSDSQISPSDELESPADAEKVQTPEMSNPDQSTTPTGNDEQPAKVSTPNGGEILTYSSLQL